MYGASSSSCDYLECLDVVGYDENPLLSVRGGSAPREQLLRQREQQTMSRVVEVVGPLRLLRSVLIRQSDGTWLRVVRHEPATATRGNESGEYPRVQAVHCCSEGK